MLEVRVAAVISYYLISIIVISITFMEQNLISFFFLYNSLKDHNYMYSFEVVIGGNSKENMIFCSLFQP